MRQVVVTGGAGFWGLHLVRRLLAGQGDERVGRLLIVDDFSRGRPDADLVEVCQDPRVEVDAVDLTREGALARLSCEVDDVYHLAAVNGTRHFYEQPTAVLRTNVLSTLRILDWASGMARAPRLLVASSNEAYTGALEAFGVLPIPTPELVPLVVPDPRNPRWSYGASKIVAELAAVHYARERGLPTVVVRPHNLYGPRAGADHVVPALVCRVLDRVDPLPLPGARQTRAFCYVEDAADAAVRLMAVASTACPIVHVGSSEEVAVAQLAERVFQVAGWRPAVVEEQPAPPGSAARRAPDVGLAHLLVGWAPTTPLDDGLERTLAWYRQHRQDHTAPREGTW